MYFGVGVAVEGNLYFVNLSLRTKSILPGLKLPDQGLEFPFLIDVGWRGGRVKVWIHLLRDLIMIVHVDLLYFFIATHCYNLRSLHSYQKYVLIEALGMADFNLDSPVSN